MNPSRLGTRHRLYENRPGCPTRHHNTAGSYRMGCRCPEAREAKRLQDKRHRQHRAKPLLRDATGTTRRLRALMLAGWRAADIASELGSDRETVRSVARGDRQYVYLATEEAVKALCFRWADRCGPSAITRSRSTRAGWLSLAAWDDIDNPAEVPQLDGPTSDAVDSVKVDRAVAGGVAWSSLNRAEKAAAYRRMVAMGMGRGTICRLLCVATSTLSDFVKTLPGEPSNSQASELQAA